MKNAYLISAHAYYDQLENLLKILDDKNNDIYIHINLKSEMPDVNRLKKMCEHSSVYFSRRVEVDWGSAGFLFAQIALLEEAYDHMPYDYYHMLSVQDMPIKSNYEINDFLESNKYRNKSTSSFTNYMNICIQKNDRRRSYTAQYNFFISEWRNKNPIIRKSIKLLNLMLVGVQKLFKIDKFKNDNITLCYGQPWWSLTNEAVVYILSNKKWIIKRFSKGSFAADETALQTLIYNSNLRETLYQDESGTFRNLMKLDFSRGNGMGSPYVWKINDLQELLNSECLFARKFDVSVDREIINKIIIHLMKGKTIYG